MFIRAIPILASCVFVFFFVAEVTCQTLVEPLPSQELSVGLSSSTFLSSGFATTKHFDPPLIAQTLNSWHEIPQSSNPSQSPIGRDIMIKDLGVTEDMELYILLAYAGPIDLREGLKLRIRIFVNHRKVSEFDHFLSERLRPHLGNHAMIHPPYRVAIVRTSRVKVSVKPLSPSEDVRPENNTVERSFLVFPFRIGRQATREFSFSVPTRSVKGSGGEEKVKTVARWDGGMAAIRLSIMRPGRSNVSTISGKSPLKMELPIVDEEKLKGSIWRVSVTNLIARKVEGHLVIQHP